MNECSTNDWQHGVLIDISDIRSGHPFKSSQFVEKSQDAVPIIRMSNLRDGKCNFDGAAYVKTIDTKNLEQFRLSEGDFVFGMSGSLENYARIRKQDLPCYLNQRVGLLSSKNNSANFVSHVFLSDIVQRQILASAAGGAQLNISVSQLAELEILIPPLAEQQKIAEILTTVDEVIENTEAEISKLEDLKKATMNDLLTKGIGHTEFKETEIGRIPKSWDVAQLGQLCEVKGGKRLPKSTQFADRVTPFPYIRVTDFVDQTIKITDLKYVDEGVQKTIARYTISSNDLYISIAGTIGRVGIVPISLNGALLTENAAKLIIKGKALRKQFLMYLLNASITQNQITRAIGTGGGVPKLALFRIESLLITIPSVKEQESISAAIISLDTAIADYGERLSKYYIVKKALMQDLLTGKVRVKVN
jgi:type I restriction enzyme S subunit